MTAEELARLQPATVVVVGGTEAISADVQRRIRATVPDADVRCYAGADRYETAAAVADDLATARDVYVATGRDFPDALAGSALAAHTSSPVLLVRPGSVPEATLETLVRLDPARVVVLGGPEAVSEEVLAELAALR